MRLAWGLVAAAAATARALTLTNTVYVDYRNAVGLPMITVTSATTFAATTAPGGGGGGGGPGTPGSVRTLVEVYDASGRLVRVVSDALTVTTVGIASVGDGHGSARLGLGAGVAIALSNGTTLSWDGRDGSGGQAPDGLYTVKVTSREPDGTYATAAQTVAVTWAFGGLIGDPVLVPNPAADAVWLGYRPGSPDQWIALRVYTVAGELVFRADVPGTQSAFRWDLRNLRGERVAPGLYVVALEARDPVTGRQDRAIRKLAVAAAGGR